MTATVQIRRSTFWGWPGPVRLYEAVIVMAAYAVLLYFFWKSGLAMSVIACFTVCAALLHGSLRRDLGREDWALLDNPFRVWTIRAAATAAGAWLFFCTPGMQWRMIAVLLYAALYIVSETAVWRRKRAVEASPQS